MAPDGLEWPVLFVVVMALLFLTWVFGEKKPKPPRSRAEVIEMIEELRKTGGKK